MKIRAEFKGSASKKHPYVPGKKYTLNFDTCSSYPPYRDYVEICKFNNGFLTKYTVTYPTLKRFLSNWEVL